MKILIVPDSFKGTLTSNEVCECIKNGLNKYNDNLEINTLPFADGGEGFAKCIKDICNGEILYTTCHNIYNQPCEGYIITTGNTAIIESATASGLLKRKNVMQASSYGTGELIKFAVSKGFSNIILGLGGSGCCDGGAGALSALGAKFYDENWNVINVPKSNDLNYIFGVDFKNIVKDINFTYACDVTNEYFGPNGASYVFAKQKGAKQSDLPELDNGLQRLNAFFKNDISKIKGAGAGGGICGGLYALYGGCIKSGFDVLSELSNLEDKIKESDLIITGEGKTDKQTLMGKLPYKISLLAKKYNKKCVVISGAIEGVEFADKMISLVDSDITVENAMENAKQILTEKSKFILH
jgi:glycerate kinase